MRTLRNVALSCALLVALIGVLHLPALRPTLLSLAGCPFPTSGRTLGPEEAERLRVATFAPQDTSATARVMPALGFALGQDDRASVARWAASNRITCEGDKHGASLRCRDVSARLLGADSAARGLLGLGFDTGDRLVSVQFALSEPDRTRALSVARGAEDQLAHAAEPTLVRAGDLRVPLSQRLARVAVRDYRGEVTATHMGRGFVVSQSYQRFAP